MGIENTKEKEKEEKKTGKEWVAEGIEYIALLNRARVALFGTPEDIRRKFEERKKQNQKKVLLSSVLVYLIENEYYEESLSKRVYVHNYEQCNIFDDIFNQWVNGRYKIIKHKNESYLISQRKNCKNFGICKISSEFTKKVYKLISYPQLFNPMIFMGMLDDTPVVTNYLKVNGNICHFRTVELIEEEKCTEEKEKEKENIKIKEGDKKSNSIRVVAPEVVFHQDPSENRIENFFTQEYLPLPKKELTNENEDFEKEYEILSISSSDSPVVQYML